MCLEQSPNRMDTSFQVKKNHLGGEEKQNFQERLLPRLKLILDRRQSDEGGADNGTLAQIGPFLDM